MSHHTHSPVHINSVAVDQPIRVLHVDDEPSFAELTATYVQREADAIEFQTETSPAAACTRLAEDEFDCIVSDYDMPGENGIEFLESVRADHPTLPFILFTGKGSESVASEAISAGVTDYLQKRTGTEQYELLANRITNTVTQYRAEQRAAIITERVGELAGASDDLLWMFSSSWEELLFITDTYEQFWGQSVEALKQDPQNFLTGIHPDDRAHVRDAMDQLSAGESVDIEYRVNESEDYGRWIWVKGQPIRDDSGDVVRVCGFARDVTEKRAREREHQELSQFREAVIRNANVWINVLDEDGTVTMWNEAAEEISGYTEAEVLGSNDIWNRLYPDDEYRESILEHVTEILQGEKAVEEFETRIRTKDGDERTISWYSHAIDGSGSGSRGSVAVGRDVTDYKRRKREFEDLKERFRTYVESSSDMISIIDNDGVSRYESPALERVLGYDPEDFVGTDNFELIHPADRESAIDTFDAVFERDDRSTGTCELRFEHADGHWVWLDVTVHSRAAPSPDAFLVISRDVSARKEREAALRKMNDRLTMALEVANAAAWEYDVESERTVWSANLDEFRGPESDQGTTGDADDDRHGGEDPDACAAFLDRIHADDRDRLVETLETIAKTGNPETVEFRLLCEPGEWRWIETRADLLEDDPSLMVGVSMDVTTTREDRQLLERQNERLNEFASVVAHDLRNPLRVADGRLALHRDGTESENLDAVSTALDRMDRIIEGMLTLAREGREVGVTHPVDLDESVTAAWRFVDTSTNGTTLEVATDGGDSGLGTIRADGERLQQLLENLFQNAIDHGGPAVSVRVEPLEAGFAVEDTGPGIDEGDSEQVFDIGHSTATDGTGFGLFIVKAIADGHGWDVALTDGTDGGARFEITGVEYVE